MHVEFIRTRIGEAPAILVSCQLSDWFQINRAFTPGQFPGFSEALKRITDELPAHAARRLQAGEI